MAVDIIKVNGVFGYCFGDHPTRLAPLPEKEEMINCLTTNQALKGQRQRFKDWFEVYAPQMNLGFGSRDLLLKWLDNNLQGYYAWSFSEPIIFFSDLDDAMKFKLELL